MTKKEKEQLKNQTSESLTKLVAKSRDTLWTLQTDLAAGKVKNVREIRKLKRLIAQSLTLMGQISMKFSGNTNTMERQKTIEIQ